MYREYRSTRLPYIDRSTGSGRATGDDRRGCHVYRFLVRDPRSDYRTRALGYIGETARMPFDRLLEHVREQPWADTIVSWEVDDAVYSGKDAVLAAERAAVEAERPLYNHEWNLDNPDRIEIWKAREQRAARDAVGGRAPVRSGRATGVGRAYRAPVRQRFQRPRDGRRNFHLPRRWERRVNRAALWVTGWLCLTVAIWWLLHRHLATLTVRSSGIVAAVAATLVCVVIDPRRWRRQLSRELSRWRRKAIRALTGAAAVGLLGLIAWVIVVATQGADAAPR
ncbi:MAG TPA: hypothetical protein VK453_08280 [Micromonosporaceae bacterium]|nr:hypothetical protein [Micromonosporaceae bacterium]